MPKPRHPKPKPHGFLVENRRARHDYTIEETLEAGLMLRGPEIKALRARRAQLDGAYVKIIGDEAWLLGGRLHVSEGDPTRTVKLLLHKAQLMRLLGVGERKGMTILPLKIYETRGIAKLQIGVGRGKKEYEHRAELKKRAETLEARRAEKQKL